MRSFNCSDLSFRSTRSKLFSILHGNPDIIFISEIKLSNPSFVNKITDFLKFRNYSFYVNSSNSSRGVAIIIKNTLFRTATITHKCPSENALLLKLTSGPLNIAWQLCVAYLDNLDNVDYLNLLTKKFDENLPIFWGGDFNSILDPEKDPKLNMDLFNRETIPNPRCSEFLAKNLSRLGLIDPFRTLKSDYLDFTYQSNGGASRLDHLLVPSFLRNCLSAVNFNLTSKSFDHKNVCVKLGNFKKIKKPKILKELIGTRISVRTIKMSKFLIYYDHFESQLNLQLKSKCIELLELDKKISSLEKCLLEREDLLLRTILDLCYKDFELTFIECNTLFDSNLKEMIDPNKALLLLLNNVKNELFSISGAVIKARKTRKNVIIANLARARAGNDHSLILQLQNDLDSINSIEIDLLGKNLPSNDPYWDFNSPGEISNYLNHSSTERLILLSKNNCEKEVDNICFTHFKSVFNQNINTTSEDLTNFMDKTGVHIKTLCDSDKGLLKCAFSKRELLECISKFKSEKSTGLDGISPMLLKEIVPICSEIFLECFNDNYLNGKQFDNSLKSSYIRLIPKSGKDPTTIGNWRPITIITTINKLYCKLIYNRLEPITDKLLEEGQSAYRPSCDLSDVFLNLKITIDSYVKAKESACLLNLDFSKAFDSLGHAFIKEILGLYQFPENFINAIMGYLSNNLSCIMLDSGKMTKFFAQACGTGQGNPLSALIFILAVNLLLIKLNHSKLLTPIAHRLYSREKIEKRCGGYADDIGILVNKSESDLENIEKILEDFGTISGLRLNKSKTELCPINFKWEDHPSLRERTLKSGFKLGGNKIKILGNFIFLDGQDESETNWNNVLKKINMILLKSSQLRLSTLNKVTIIKSFILSNISFTARTASLNEHFLDNIRNRIITFLGFSNNKKGIFSCSDTNGLNIPCIKSFCDAILIKNLARCLKHDSKWGKLLIQQFKFKEIDRSLCETPGNYLMNLAGRLSTFCCIYYEKNPKKAPVFFSPFVSKLCKSHEIGRKPPTPSVEGAGNFSSSITLFELVRASSNKNTLEDLLGYRISFLNYFRIFSASTFMKKKFPFVESNTLNAINFLKTAKDSKIIRSILTSDNTKTKNLFEKYCGRNNAEVETRSFFEFVSKSYFPTNFRNFFINLKLNNIKSRAQLSHFTDVEPLCITCRANNTNLHMFVQCQTMQTIVNRVLRELLNVADFELADIYGGFLIEHDLKKASHLILGACLFTSFYLDKRLKLPNYSAAKNAAVQICKMYAQTPKGKLYFENIRNTPLYTLIS